MALLFKGVLVGAAGPAPNYDMQRILSTRNPREACLMSGPCECRPLRPALFDGDGPHHSGLGFFRHQSAIWASSTDFEQCCPMRLEPNSCPRAWLGLSLAGLLAAFMSNLAATMNAAPALYGQRHLQALHQSEVLRATRHQLSSCRVLLLVALAMGSLFGLVLTVHHGRHALVVAGLWAGYPRRT